MLASILAALISWPPAPALVTPGQNLAQVAVLLRERPHTGCRPEPFLDYRTYYFDRAKVSVIADWRGKVISVASTPP